MLIKTLLLFRNSFLRVPEHWQHPNRIFVSPNPLQPSDLLISTPLMFYTQYFTWNHSNIHSGTYTKPLTWPWLQLFWEHTWPWVMWDLLFVPHHNNRKRDIWAVQIHLGTVTLVVSSHLSCISQIHRVLEPLERYVRDFYLIPLCLILINSSVLLYKGYFNCNID